MAFFNELESELARKEFKNRQLNFQIPLRDQKWIEENEATWQSTTDQLQAEYKRHKDEGVKESTRRAMEDLFQHYMMAGKIDEAIRLYSRGIRDYCTQLKHSINVWNRDFGRKKWKMLKNWLKNHKFLVKIRKKSENLAEKPQIFQ